MPKGWWQAMVVTWENRWSTDSSKLSQETDLLLETQGSFVSWRSLEESIVLQFDNLLLPDFLPTSSYYRKFPITHFLLFSITFTPVRTLTRRPSEVWLLILCKSSSYSFQSVCRIACLCLCLYVWYIANSVSVWCGNMELIAHSQLCRPSPRSDKFPGYSCFALIVYMIFSNVCHTCEKFVITCSHSQVLSDFFPSFNQSLALHFTPVFVVLI